MIKKLTDIAEVPELRKRILFTLACLAVYRVGAAIPIPGNPTIKQGGLNFQVPEDWPIEKRGGILAPIPTEEYVSIKFKATEEKFETIKQALTQAQTRMKLPVLSI